MTAPSPGQAAPSPEQAAYEAYWTRMSAFVVTPWVELAPPTEREAWEAAAQAAIAAAPACPCGGMPGTACGDLIVQLRADIARLETIAADVRVMRHLNTTQGALIRDLKGRMAAVADDLDEAGAIMRSEAAERIRAGLEA